MSLPSMEELNERSIRGYLDREHPGLDKAAREEAAQVASAAYRGNTTLRDACESGIRYVKSRREGG